MDLLFNPCKPISSLFTLFFLKRTFAQLCYTHRKYEQKYLAGQGGFEPTATGFGDRRSNQLELLACINYYKFIFLYELCAYDKTYNTSSIRIYLGLYACFLLLYNSYVYIRHKRV